ncbi:MAG TPA: hypothetical protein VFW23_01880 [Tepidisphaeraceae bacterium]|nr:hypothetical protein [Tepidisphaeraceae bacterium]
MSRELYTRSAYLAFAASWERSLAGHLFTRPLVIGLFDRNLIFSVEPATEVDQLAALAAKGEELAAGRGAIIRNRVLANRTFHYILPWAM